MYQKIKANLKIKLFPWVEQFLLTYPRLKKKTFSNYRCTIMEFFIFLEKVSREKDLFLAIQQETIVCWLKKTAAGHSIYTVMHRAGLVSAFFSFLKKNGMVWENPLRVLQEKYPKKGLKGIVLSLIGSSPQKSMQALKLSPQFVSPLGSHMKQFIKLNQAQGKIFKSEKHALSFFDRFLMSFSPPPKLLSDKILQKWLGLFSRARHGYRYKTFGVIKRFCLYLRRFNPKAYVPDISMVSYPPPFLPYIYSKAEIIALLKASRQLKPTFDSPLRPQMLYLMILLLHTTGLRIGEALKLKLCDINWEEETLYIRETKFFKSRLVPLSCSMMRELKSFIHLRYRSEVSNDPQSLVFQNPHREKPYWNSTVSKWFNSILRRLGLKPMKGYVGPRIHDLRATFAVHRLEEWYRRGEDVQTKIGLLSTYLGHSSIAGTQHYLTMTTELLQQASQRFNKYFILNSGGQNENK